MWLKDTVYDLHFIFIKRYGIKIQTLWRNPVIIHIQKVISFKICVFIDSGISNNIKSLTTRSYYINFLFINFSSKFKGYPQRFCFLEKTKF